MIFLMMIVMIQVQNGILPGVVAKGGQPRQIQDGPLLCKEAPPVKEGAEFVRKGELSKV
jgi:hypothetical protein